MEEEVGAVNPADGKDGQARRTSGIGSMWPFTQRHSMDTDDHGHSSDRPRKAGMGGKVKPGFGGKHKHSNSGDLSTPAESAASLACSAADSPSAAWASSSYPPAEVTDTLSLSQLSPAPVSTGKGKGISFFKGFGTKRRSSNKGSASPGLPSSPTLPGATPTHASNISFSASGSSLSGAGGSQSPSDSLCRAGAGASAHAAGSKLGLNSSSGDPDDADYGSCYSDAMHSPSYQDAMYGGDTLDLRHASYDMPADASPMATMRQELPEVFTPGFNQLLHQDCSVGREPETPLDAAMEPTVALLSTAQLSQVAQMYDVQSMLLNPKAADPERAITKQGTSNSAAATEPMPKAETTPVEAAKGPAANSSSGGQTLREMQDVTAAEEPTAERTDAPAPQQQPAQVPVAAEDVSVSVVGEAPAAAPAAAQDNSTDAPGAPAPSAGDAASATTAEPAAGAEPSGTHALCAPEAGPEPAAADAASEVPAATTVAQEQQLGDAEPKAAAVEAAPASEAPGAGVRLAAAETADLHAQAVAEEPEAEAPAAEVPGNATSKPAAAPADSACAVGDTTGDAQEGEQRSSRSLTGSPEAPAVADEQTPTEQPPAAAKPEGACAGGARAVAECAEQHANAEGDAAADTKAAEEAPPSSSATSPVAVQRAGSPEPACTTDSAELATAAAGDAEAGAQQQQQQQQEKQVTVCEAAGSAPAPAEVATEVEQQQEPLATTAPQAEAEPSSSAQPDTCSADVASHAINVVNSELSLAETSSSSVAQASQQQPEHHSSSPQQQAAVQQPEAPAGQQELTAAPGFAQQLDAVADTAAAATAERGEPSTAAALNVNAAAAEPETPLQLQEASESLLSAEGSGVALPLPAEDSGLEADFAWDAPEPTLSLMPEASEEPVLPADDDEDLPGSPTRVPSSTATGVHSSPVISHPRSAGRRTGRTPPSVVRESIPLFLSDPNRAVGTALMVEDSLDDQDMQQLAGAHLTSAALAAGGAAAAGSRLLAHGGPQRVTFGGLGGNPLTPVAEGFAASPIPEETSTGGSSQSRSSSRYEAAAAGSPGTSPVRQLAMSAQGTSPRLGTTPGSVYSTPTLTMGQAGVMGGRTQLGATPASALSSAVGSAIRDIGSAGAMGTVDRTLSPPMAVGMNVSPTLQLLPNMSTGAGQGTSGDGSTPSLLDACAASPSAVYNSLYTTTPFRGALAALPIDAAVNAPLIDSSPFDLTDDGFEKCGLADEAKRVAQNLAAAAAAGGFGTTPFPSRTPAPNMQRPLTPGGTGLRPAQLVERMASPELTDGLNQMHNQMLIKQLTAAEKRVKELEGENMRLKEQVDIYEFEKTELNSQEEMEKQARLYAESELQKAKMDNQALQKANMDKESEMQATKQKWQELLEEAQRAHQQEKEANMALQQQLAQMQDERNQALDRINLLDMELTAVRGNTAGLQMALQKEQQHGAELEATVAAKDKDLADMTRINNELRGKLEKAMEQLIAAQTAKEHAREKAHEESAKAVQYYNECQQMSAERQQLLAERQQLLAASEKRNNDWQALKAKYIQKSSTLKEVEARLQAKEAEVAELMGMCDQLLQQQEARGG